MLFADPPQDMECRLRTDCAHTDDASPAPPRLTGLDGLRAIAVTAVVLFHADFRWARGGYLGVDLFFVISGFLITGLLAREAAATGRIDLGHFYWRRAKRLLPAAWLMMAAVVIAAALVASDALPHLRRDTVASLLYVTNWELLHSHTSYFEAMGRPPLLQHLWSLAIEEQFYILWAPLVLLMLPHAGRRKLAFIAIVLGLASAAWMYLLAHKLGYPEQGDASRLYFGTDTHAFALLLGAAAGLLWEPAQRSPSPGTAARGFGLLLGMAALAGMGLLFATLGEETPTLYPWGFLLAAVASIVLVVVATHPGLALGRWLDVRPLRWIGERSYGIYLWHWPVFMLTRPGIDLRGMNANEAFILRITLTVVIAALSYRFVEMPIRHGAIERVWRDARLTSRQRKAWARGWLMAASVALIFYGTGSVLWRAPANVVPAQDVRDALNLDAAVTPVHISVPTDNGKGSKKKYAPLTVNLADTPLVAATAPVKEPVVPVPTPAPDVQPDVTDAETFSGNDITAVGDSVLLGSSRMLKVTLPGVDVHATVGWQAADMIRQLQALKSGNQLRPAVLLHLGTNGYVTENQLRQMLSMLADCKRVVLVNTRVPRRWMDANNTLIDRVAPEFPNVVVARWSDISEDQPDYFVSDGVHLTIVGQRAFIADIMSTGHLARDAKGMQHDKAPTDLPNTHDSLGNELFAPQLANDDTIWHKMPLCDIQAYWRYAGEQSSLGATFERASMSSTPLLVDAVPEAQVQTTGFPSASHRWHCAAAFDDSNADWLRQQHLAYLTPPKLDDHLAGADSPND